jgi:hypothetical protein
MAHAFLPERVGDLTQDEVVVEKKLGYYVKYLLPQKTFELTTLVSCL